MSITNEPIFLDSTARAILEQKKIENAYLQFIAESERQEVFDSMAQIAHIVRSGTIESNARVFPFGDQIIMPWKDLDDSARDTSETAYSVAWNIVKHEMVTLKDGRQVPGMYLQMHKCSAYGVQFSHAQAFYQAEATLPAGTYNVTFGVKYNDDFPAGSTGQFTLSDDLPVGGRLLLNGNNVEAWESATEAEAAESVPMTVGSSGTGLGTISNTATENGLNIMARVKYGNARWSVSAIRQYLNADGTNWYSSPSGEKFDIRPDQYAKHGFMSGFNDDFLDAIKPVKVATVRDLPEGSPAEIDYTYDTFFLPSLEQMNVQPNYVGAEGETFEYWQTALGSQEFVPFGSDNTYDAFVFSAINSDAPQPVRLRSAFYAHGSTAYVHTSGYVTSNQSYSPYRFAPVCVIC